MTFPVWVKNCLFTLISKVGTKAQMLPKEKETAVMAQNECIHSNCFSLPCLKNVSVDLFKPLITAIIC